jgi:serine O-acetyltransferase
MFENIRQDLRAHGGNWAAQGFWVLVAYRFGRWRYGVRPAVLRKACSLVYKVWFKLIQIICGVELPCEAQIGRNFVIDHFGAIVVSGYAKIGDDCRIRTGVVIGLRRITERSAPVIGNNVEIGAGAKLLGAISIGNNVIIGANAVVICDVPDDCVAVGVPAVVKPMKTYRSSARRFRAAPGPASPHAPIVSGAVSPCSSSRR